MGAYAGQVCMTIIIIIQDMLNTCSWVAADYIIQTRLSVN